jgi:hypothetical protein
MRTFAALAAAGAILLTQAASAATVPKISGVYDLMTTTVCQASVPVIPTEVYVPGSSGPVTTDVITIDPNETTNTGNLKQLFATATFSGAKVTATGTEWGGDLVFTGTSQGTSPGLAAQALSSIFSYTNTATQLTLIESNGNEVYQVLYSGIVGGVAQRMDLVRVDTVNGCVEQGMAVRQ